MKKGLIAAWLIFLLIAIGFVFYYSEWKYSLPTPVPQNYKPVSTGETIVVPNFKYEAAKPLFLHFYNPDCPCSRFNIAHFKSLVKEYAQQVQFAIVPMTEEPFTEEEIQRKIGLQLPVLSDTSIAALCGVYSTPQAVIINGDQKLIYRGNYNKSRYCEDSKTAYAKLALESLLSHFPNPAFDAYALKAYGCELPACNK